MYKIYGIPNCGTVKKALTHLDKKKLTYEFINFKKSPPTKELLTSWKEVFGEWPVNKNGPTFRKIKDDYMVATTAAKHKLLIENSSAIKRPILEKNGKVIQFGYDEEFYGKLR